MRDLLKKVMAGSMVAGAALLVASTSEQPQSTPKRSGDDIDQGGVGDDQRKLGDQPEI